jgi:hypothetical protein
MLFADIKSYLIELEQDQDEIYLTDLEDCTNIDQLIQVVAEYNGIDDFEAARLILDKITN